MFAKEKGFYTSGQDIDLTTPDNTYIISSQIKDTYTTIMYLLDDYFADKEWKVDNETWGISEGAIGAVHVTHKSVNPITDRISAEQLAELKQVADDIASGKIDLKNIPAEESYK